MQADEVLHPVERREPDFSCDSEVSVSTLIEDWAAMQAELAAANALQRELRRAAQATLQDMEVVADASLYEQGDQQHAPRPPNTDMIPTGSELMPFIGPADRRPEPEEGHANSVEERLHDDNNEDYGRYCSLFDQDAATGTDTELDHTTSQPVGAESSPYAFDGIEQEPHHQGVVQGSWPTLDGSSIGDADSTTDHVVMTGQHGNFAYPGHQSATSLPWLSGPPDAEDVMPVSQDAQMSWMPSGKMPIAYEQQYPIDTQHTSSQPVSIRRQQSQRPAALSGRRTFTRCSSKTVQSACLIANAVNTTRSTLFLMHHPSKTGQWRTDWRGIPKNVYGMWRPAREAGAQGDPYLYRAQQYYANRLDRLIEARSAVWDTRDDAISQKAPKDRTPYDVMTYLRSKTTYTCPAREQAVPHGDAPFHQ